MSKFNLDEFVSVQVGGVYRNLKHGTLYHVLGFSRHSETLEVMVQYERVDPEFRDEIPWDRPLKLFIKKFELAGES